MFGPPPSPWKRAGETVVAGWTRAVVVEGEQEQTADGDRDRAEREPFEHELGRLGPGQRNGDDEHDPERDCSAERQAGAWPTRAPTMAATATSEAAMSCGASDCALALDRHA